MPPPGPRSFPDAEQVRQLPVQLRMDVPAEWEDRNGHVNVQYFTRLYELGGWNITENLGFDEAWFRSRNVSLFDHEHHTHFLAEIHVGEQVSTYHRLVGLSEKRMHGVYFIVNDTHDRLAATLEYVCSHVDMVRRRTAPIHPDLMAGLQQELQMHRQLEWEAPVCGVISA